ncbi:MAG: sugar phosphate nucleotidyltransferase [Nanoarchaeota archaeon]
MKKKIAVSLDKDLLEELDRAKKGTLLRSRSQAIEYFLGKGLREREITTAVLLLHKRHQIISLRPIDGRPLLGHQLDWFSSHGIKKVLILTQFSALMNRLLVETSAAPIAVEVVDAEVRGNGEALAIAEPKLKGPFVVMSGDILNSFDLKRMIQSHLREQVIATMGLMDRQEPSKYGSAIMEGNRIISFAEKTKSASSHVVNAGIYIFSPEVFSMLKKVISLERDLFPRLAKDHRLLGYFTRGDYRHVTD